MSLVVFNPEQLQPYVLLIIGIVFLFIAVCYVGSKRHFFVKSGGKLRNFLLYAFMRCGMVFVFFMLLHYSPPPYQVGDWKGGLSAAGLFLPFIIAAFDFFRAFLFCLDNFDDEEDPVQSCNQNIRSVMISRLSLLLTVSCFCFLGIVWMSIHGA